jgi:hypothetical protein
MEYVPRGSTRDELCAEVFFLRDELETASEQAKIGSFATT